MFKCILILSATFFLHLSGKAQSFAINTDGSTANPSAILDVKSNLKGILVPRMTSAQRTAIASPATGLMVYDTDINSFWYYSGTAWVDISAANKWLLTGNSGTNPAINFLGTTDNQPLRFRINNTWAGEINPTSSNYFLGLRAGVGNTSGYSNVAIGTDALSLNTSRNDLVAIGDSSLYHNGTGAVAVGEGSQNVAVGSFTMYSNTTGYQNTAIGHYTMYNNTTGFDNTTLGKSTMYNNTTGSYNTALGYQPLFYSTTGSYNTAVGGYALFQTNSASKNVAVGYEALRFQGTSFSNGNVAYETDNTAVGYDALYSNQPTSTANGAGNTGIGMNSLYYNITGNFNTALGYNSGVGVAGNYNNTVSIGNNGYLNLFSNQAFLGNLSTGWNGGNQAWSTFSDARIKTNIQEDVKGLEFITRLRPVTYNRNIRAAIKLTGNEETPDYPGKYDIEKIKYSGFLAQDVEKAAHEAGYDFSGYTKPRSDKELYTLSYEQFVVPMVKAIQEQQALIEKLTKQVNQQQVQYEALLKRVNAKD